MYDLANSVDNYFEASARYWEKIYEEKDLTATLYQERQRVTLDLINSLALSSDGCILDVGCGAGTTAVALAQLGFTAVALDRVPAMLERTRARAEKAGVSHLLRPVAGDAYALDFADRSFDVVMALGVIPWLSSPAVAVREMIRVTKPTGHLIFSADNRWRLNRVLDPIDNPMIAPLRCRIASVIRKHGPGKGVNANTHSPHELDNFLRSLGLRKLRGVGVGFGPFTFLRARLLPGRTEIRLHQWLQRKAENGLEVLGKLGAHYVVLAKAAAGADKYASAPAGKAGVKVDYQ